jgi:uncharacterized membrane protein YhaH (DUF805 family)
MYYYKDSSKNIIYVKSKESLINLISQNIISENTEIRIGLRGTFIEAKEIEDLKDLFQNDEKFVGDFNLNDEKNENQEEFLEQDKLTEIDDENYDNDSYIETKEESTTQNIIESPWNNELADEVEIGKNVQEDEIVEEKNADEDISEQEYQQDSEYEEDEPIDDTEAHASAYVSFPTAVKLAFKNYFNFSDRSSRSEYWYFTLFMILIVIGTTFLAALMPSEVFAIILPIGYIVCLIASLSLGVRRLHDTDKRGWYILIGIIPIIGEIFLIIMFALPGNIKENRFGVKTLGAE